MQTITVLTAHKAQGYMTSATLMIDNAKLGDNKTKLTYLHSAKQNIENAILQLSQEEQLKEMENHNQGLYYGQYNSMDG